MNEYAIQFLNLSIGLSIGIASLASLLAIFRSGPDFDKSDSSEFKSIILSCLLLSIGCLSPFLLASSSYQINIWAILSISYAICASILTIYFFLSVELDGLVSISLFILNSFTIVISIGNVFLNQQDLYLACIFWGVGLTISRFYMFLMYVTHKIKGNK